MRVEGWEKKLDLYIQKSFSEPYVRGVSDCLIFASDACIITCGKDPMSKSRKNDPKTIRGKYKTGEKAYQLIKKYRGSIPAIMDEHFERINPNFAQRGDVVLAKVPDSAFGICWNGGAMFKTQDRGIVKIPLINCKYAWRVE